MTYFEEMKQSVVDGDEDAATKLAELALEKGLDLQKVMDEGFLAGIQEAGRLYEEEEFYLPDIVCAADAMKAALAVLDGALKSSTGAGLDKTVKVVLATVQGDVHDIGKTIVGAMMTAAGFEVVDLGPDVNTEVVIRTVKEINPDVLGLSALLTTTMAEQGNIIKMLDEQKLRKSVKVIIGGAPVNQAWADRVGADGYSDNALAAVKLVERLIKQEAVQC
ncbi:corrinoid protein [Bacillota bacterium]